MKWAQQSDLIRREFLARGSPSDVYEEGDFFVMTSIEERGNDPRLDVQGDPVSLRVLPAAMSWHQCADLCTAPSVSNDAWREHNHSNNVGQG